MKLLLDENLPHDLRHFLAGHKVFTVQFMRWAGVKNGRLLQLAGQEGFDALLTLDSGIPFQTNLSQLPCSLVVIRAPGNKLADLQPLLNELLDAIALMHPCSLVRVP